MVIDPLGRFHLFYHDQPAVGSNNYFAIRVVYGYSDDLGVTWNPSNNFYSNPVSQNQRSYLVEGSRYDIQNNILWTFWKEEDLLGMKGGDMMCTYSLDRGVSWSIPEYITDHDSTSIGFKAVALLNNGAIAVNYESPKTPTTGQIRVVYRERNPVALSVKNIDDKENINVFPNPNNGIFNVLLNKNNVQRIEIFNIKGQLVYNNNINLEKSININIKGFNQGLYILKLITTDKVLTQKIIKQ